MSATRTADIIELPTAEIAAIRRVEEYGVLLTRPRELAAPDHPWVYCLRDGRVGRCSLKRYRLPQLVRHHALVVPGPVQTHTVAMLPLAAELLDRMVPWVTVHVVPRLLAPVADRDAYASDRVWHVVGTREYVAVGGLACRDEGVILMTAQGSPTAMAATAAHEALHMVWELLSEEARAVLVAAVAHGADWPSDYYGCDEERVARMFENWAGSFLEGQPRRAVPANQLTVDRIFQAIWDGTVADELILDDRVPDAARHRARRGLRLPEPARPPLLERVGLAVFGGIRSAFA